LHAKEAAENSNDDFAFAVNGYHVDLHLRIADYARSEVLRAEIEKSHVLVFNWLYDTTRGGRILPPNFHGDLIGAISTGEPPKAEEAMRAHVNYGLDTVQLAMQPLHEKKWRLKY
jgi:DNA-binding FadR family transcriptional regulator